MRVDAAKAPLALARTALGGAPAKRRTAAPAVLKTIIAQDDQRQAEARWAAVADALRETQERSAH